MDDFVKRVTASDYIYQGLKDRIMNGYYQAGVRLNEAQISKDFGTSATPVREALNILCAEGFLERDPFKGMIIRTYSLQDIKDAYWLYGKVHLLYIKGAMESSDYDQWNEMVILLQEQIEQDNGSHIFIRVLPFIKKLRELSNSQILENCLHSIQAVINLENAVGHTEESIVALEEFFKDMLKGLRLKDYIMVEKQCDQIVESSINSLNN